MKSLGLLIIPTVLLILGWSNGFDLLFRASFLLATGLVLGRLWVWSHLRQVESSWHQSLLASGPLPQGEEHPDGSIHRVQVGQKLGGTIELRNHSFIPKPWLELRLESDLPQPPRPIVVALRGRSARVWTFPLSCYQRGQFSIGPVVLCPRAPLGLSGTRLSTGCQHL